MVLTRFFYGKSMKEVGDALGGSEGAARLRVHRAMDAAAAIFPEELRDCLDGDDHCGSDLGQFRSRRANDAWPAHGDGGGALFSQR